MFYLYKSDFAEIENIIENEFQVIEKVDKLQNQGSNKFGYGAVHYLVRLGKKASGARYDDLKDLLCEIQVKTVLQDAWSIIDHHLIYKQESDVPTPLKRKLNALSGQFELADDQFDQIRLEREQYLKSLKGKSEGDLNQEINYDTLYAFLKTKYPNLQVSKDSNYLSSLVSRLKGFGYNNYNDLTKLFSDTRKVRIIINKERKALYASSHLVRALALTHPKYRDEFIAKEWKKYYEKYSRKIKRAT